MRRKAVDILLESLDESVNSSSYWITLGVSEGKSKLKADLLQHLETGSFHFELVKEDIGRGFYDYSEMVFAKGFDSPSFLPKPGNVWNGTSDLKIEALSKQKSFELLLDLLTGGQDYFSKSSLGKQFDEEKGKQIIDDFFKALDENGEWKVFNIQPDFLNQMDEYYSTNYIQLGYFENCKRDLALAIMYEDEVNILLTNGYN